MVSVSLRELLETPPDAYDIECLRRALDAGVRGDLRASLAHQLDATVVVESPHRFVLQDLLDQEDSAPAWAYSRWCADLASRWMLLTEDPRVDTAVRHVMAFLYPDALEQVIDDEVEFRIFGTKLAAGDHAVADIALYELGGLADFIDARAEVGLLDRTDRVREWAGATMNAFQYREVQGCRLVLQDLVDGGEVEVLNLGAVSAASDDWLVGRLVPISAEPGLMFAAAPIFIDRQTAEMVAEALRRPEEASWLTALSLALADGRQAEGFHRTATTLFTSDLPMPEIVVREAGAGDDTEEAGRIRELRAKGYSADVANALAVLEVGIIAADISDHAAAAVSPHVVAALGTRGAFTAATTECVGPETAEAWRILAGVVPDHVAERCRTLARLAAGSGASH